MKLCSEKPKKKYVYAMAAASLLTLTACGGSSSGSGGSSDGPLTMRLWAEINSLDPHKTDSGASYQLTEFLYDRVVTLQQGVVKPGLATKWEVSPKKVVLTINPDVTCSNGDKLTPTAIKNSFDRVVDPATKNPVAGDFLPDATFAADDQAGTVTVSVPDANSGLLIALAEPNFSVVCPEGLKNPSMLQTAAFGSGPYVLDKAVRGSSYSLSRRDDYAWGPDGASNKTVPEKVDMRVVTNETTATNQMLAGDLDLMVAEKPSSAKRLGGQSKLTAVDATVGLAFVMFNVDPQRQTSDEAVRRAVAHLVDPKAFTAAAQGELGTVSPGDLFPPVTACSETDGSTLRPSTDPAEAEKVLKADGWSKAGGVWTKNGKSLSLVIHSNEAVGQSGDYLAQTLKDFGIKVTVKLSTMDQYVDDAAKNEWDVYSASLSASASPAVIGVVFGGGLDFGKIRNDTVTSEVEKATLASSPEEACSHWAAAQNALFADATVVPQTWLNARFFGRGVEFEVWSSGLVEPTTLRLTN